MHHYRNHYYILLFHLDYLLNLFHLTLQQKGPLHFRYAHHIKKRTQPRDPSSEKEASHTLTAVNGRRSRLDPQPGPVPTVLVVTQTTRSPAEARGAARKIRHFLQARFPRICADIMDSVLVKPLRSFSVVRSESIFSKWDKIRDAILSTLDIRE